MHTPIILSLFPGGKTKALTLSYDDGVVQDIRLIEILNRYGLKGTFHCNAGCADKDNRIPLAQYAEVYRGHEVAAHSVSHPSLPQIPADKVAWEVVEDRRLLEEAVGYPVRGMSYPFGTYNEAIIASLPHYGIDYCRTVLSHGGFSLPDRFHEWHPTLHHRTDLLAKAQAFIDANTQYWVRPSLFYLWGHSYEFDRNEENNNWELIEAFAAKVAPEKETIWFATNIEIHDYMQALRRLRTGVTGRQVENHSHLRLWIAVQGEVVELAPGERRVF